MILKLLPTGVMQRCGGKNGRILFASARLELQTDLEELLELHREQAILMFRSFVLLSL